jgi:nitrous oxidase accessory protein NosD
MNDMKKRNLNTLLAVACLVLSVAVFGDFAVAAVLEVPTQYSSINKALAAAVSGDTIKVAGGTYFERITMKKGVILEGAWSEDFTRRDIGTIETVIDGINEKGPVVTCADDAVLDGFTIIHGTLLQDSDVSEGSGIYCNNSSPTIQNNTVKENEPSGIFCSTSAAVVLKNRIYGNAQAGVYIEKGSAVKIKENEIWDNGYSAIGSGKKPQSTFEIVQNILHNNKRSGVSVQTATGIIKNNLIYDNERAGIRCVPMPVEIINNTVDGNGWAGILLEDPEAVPNIKNNIISYNTDGGIRATGNGYDHNLLFANGVSGDCDPRYLWCVKPQFGGYEDDMSYPKHNNIIANPLYKDRANHDYHLQARSPAIDSGDRKPEFNDVHFPSSLGSERNDMGFYGGPLALSEKRNGNGSPQAIIAEVPQAFVGEQVILDGKESIDPDGDVLTYLWKITQTPEGSGAKLRKADRAKTAFKIDKPGEYVVQLLVTDSQGAVSEPQKVEIHVPMNRVPVANISEIISQMKTGDTLTFYGNASKDPEGAPLSYQWSLIFRPSVSQASLSGNGDSSSLYLDVDGSYTVQLIVNDGELDSAPATVNISTKKPVTVGIRRVPEEYPTIQAALDAASPGDDIIVQKGRYNELLVVEKSVNLIGKNWPVIDGGRQEGNKNTIAIFYLGDRAGRVEGFVITGGGSGELGHGINIWDSSPDIYNNRITGNNHGMGIHGSPSLTNKTKVHGNIIYKNNAGIGNGKDSMAHIYNNRVFKNNIVGIGCRGLARPNIRNNYIYNNHLGVGAREVASPTIEGNHIFNNVEGIVISPLSTIKRSSFDDIIIKNNLVVRNEHLGVNVTSFNLSNIFITNNTIDSNNIGKIKVRGGGVVLGYPQPAEYTAVVENNIISNNLVGGLVKYIGPDLFQKPGAIVKNKHNNLWNNTVNYLETQAGDLALSLAPSFDGNSTSDIESYFNAAATQGASDIGYKYELKDFAELPDPLVDDVVPDEL